MESSEATMQGIQKEDEEEWDEEGYEDEEDDVDAEAEAEAIARRLGEELLAGIAKAQADQANKLAGTAQTLLPVNESHFTTAAGHVTTTSLSDKVQAAMSTINNILNLLENDASAKTTFSTTLVTDASGASANVFDILKQISSAGAVAKDVAGGLSQVMMTLASSETLFGSPHSNVQEQLDSGKRKRDGEGDDTNYRTVKRPFYAPSTSGTDLQAQMLGAIGIVSQALSSRAPNHPIESSFVSSVQPQLHQIFLFAVTSAALGGPYMHALQEIGGLIQVLGVLSGIQIGPAAGPGGSWIQPAPTSGQADIVTAVYPCLVPGCQKTFSRLFSLRAHQRVHATHRPFRCTHCPASFVRNHDLKRHTKLHDKKGWKCTGCGKLFSRRDAIKRHKNNSKGKDGSSSICVDAQIEEVEIDDQQGEEVREERRAKIWNGITEQQNANARAAIGYPSAPGDGSIEEGEIPHPVIVHVQSAMMELHGLLQAHVTNALGSQSGNPATTAAPSADPTGQATLASVIARAQSSLPLGVVVGEPAVPSSTIVATATTVDAADAGGASQEPQVKTSTDDGASSLSMIGLSAEQAQLLEQAIASAALAAQAQAEAEAALEEEEDDYEDQDGDYEDMEQMSETATQAA